MTSPTESLQTAVVGGLALIILDAKHSCMARRPEAWSARSTRQIPGLVKHSPQRGAFCPPMVESEHDPGPPPEPALQDQNQLRRTLG